jgi:hypothetical protein
VGVDQVSPESSPAKPLERRILQRSNRSRRSNQRSSNPQIKRSSLISNSSNHNNNHNSNSRCNNNSSDQKKEILTGELRQGMPPAQARKP